ncbi:hypothetical protein [Stenotrophomonas indicatrix]|uniref:hypothetical protein n=1 Tax=Stenotrophomonas indicatrix TaxID=2045451 RepID=UPI0011874711|nr:hypothetical protein [Stenotrophomonas indicatrix]
MTAPNEELPEDTGAQPTDPVQVKGDERAWSRIGRTLTARELASSGAQKLLLEDVERLYRENARIPKLVEDLHEEKLETCKLNAKLDTKKSIEIASTAMSNVGAVLVGFGPFAWDKLKLVTFVFVAVGIALMIAGFTVQRISR